MTHWLKALTAGLLLVAGSAAAQTVTLVDSGPVTTSQNGQIVENLRIVSGAGSNGITVNHDDVVVRNVEILHAGGHGILINGGARTRVEKANVRYTAAPPAGANAGEHNNIQCLNAADVILTQVRLRDGSAGIHTIACPRIHVSQVEGYNFRGPFPRGQVVQFDTSNDAILEDFYTKNDPAIAWTEDNVSSWHSSNSTFRRGLVDGNNSPSGIGVIFEHASVADVGLVEDVDAVRMGNGCFSAADAHNVTFRNARCRQNICGDLSGRGPSLSNSLMFASYLNTFSDNIRYFGSKYWASCNGNIAWDLNAMQVAEFTEENYAQRNPIILTFPWEGGTPPPANIFSDGFETGIQWARSGNTTWYTGSPKVGTHSVRLRQKGRIQRTISLAGRTGVSVSFKLAANSLDSSSEKVQAHYWDGASWRLLAEILNSTPQENNQLHPFILPLSASVNGLASFALRFRVLGNSTSDYGYVDDVSVSAS